MVYGTRAQPIKESAYLQSLLVAFSTKPWLGILAGAVFTGINTIIICDNITSCGDGTSRINDVRRGSTISTGRKCWYHRNRSFGFYWNQTKC